jgi:hypothetical protein
MIVRFRPLPVWPHPVTKNRSASAFTATYSNTLILLEYEIAKLGGSNVIIGAGFEERDIRNDGMPRADARPPRHPGIELSFDSKHGRLVYATDAFEGYYYRQPGWQANLRAIALGLQDLRRLDRYGIAKRGEQYAGWKALSSGSGDPTTETEAWDILYRAAGTGDVPGPRQAYDGDFQALYRLAVKRVHPDVGGNGEAFKRVEAAKRFLERVKS